ncbi:nicotinate-nucleotide--dimethylbenzimidazole phosphoribosyltransferase [Streptomyces thermolineatus]|uniref:nicotinate-nucleotide--dimethylbenzimidazole phosphoribosyltransferase n=1 Tax=Streptomyces thermolineatus TaxID=44033 RepID=UPI00384F8381
MSDLNLDDFASLVERPDAGVQRDSEERRQRLVPPAGSLGRLEELGDWLAAAQGRCPARPLERVKVLLVAGDHGVARLGVSARPAGSTAAMVRAVLDGSAAVNVMARRFGARVRVLDLSVDADEGAFPPAVTRHHVRRGSGRIDVEDALTPREAEQAFRAGMAVADEEADSGTDLVLLGDLSVGGTTVAGVLTAALCGTDASVVTGRGSGIDDLAWMRKCAAIRDALRRARPVLGDQLQLLAAVGGADFAATTGFLLQAAVRRLPVVLDGVVSSACALVAQRVAFRAPDWWLAGQSTGEPAQAKALDRLALDPLLDHGVRLGEATGALLALPMLRAAAALAAELPERPEEPETPETPEGPESPGAPEAPGEPAEDAGPAEASPH